MAQRDDHLSPELVHFIGRQKIFFVATAARDGRVNLSPKGHESLAVAGPNEIVWLNLTGSGNETAAHLLDIDRMTLMWCAFEGPPQILRVYGSAQAVHPGDEAWKSCTATVAPELGARQYLRLAIDLVQTSCGYAVPRYDYREDRTALRKWTEKKGREGLERYWRETNATSLDGRPTGIAPERKASPKGAG
jgi:hypothetical protein